MAQEIHVPDIGDFKNVEVIDVLVKAGDRIEVDTPLITIETEKATMDVPSTTAGVVKSVAIKKGDRVSKGATIAVLTVTGSATVAVAPTAAPAAPAPKATSPAPVAPVQAAPVVSGTLPMINEVGFAKAYAG